MRPGPAALMLVALPRNRLLPDRRVAALRVADLEIDALHQRIRQGPREVRLTPGEHMLLYTLAARAGAVVSYRELADVLGGTGSAFRNNMLARHLSTLRRKLRDDPERPRYVETVSGVGLRFVAAPER